MKVLMISSGTNVAFFKEGSSEQERMKKYGRLVDELHIIVFSPPGYDSTQLSENVWIYPTNSSFKLLYVADGFTLAKKILPQKSSNWVVTTQDPFEAGIVGWLLKKVRKVGWHAQIHSDIFSSAFRDSLLNHLRIFIAKLILGSADGIRVVSKRAAKNLRQATNMSADKVEVYPIFVDVSECVHTPPSFDVKARFAKWDYHLLIVSRLNEEKNIHLSLEALKILVSQGLNVGLIIVGDGPLRSDLEKLSHDLGIQARVVFEGWKEDVLSYYKTTDVFLLFSRYEGYNRSLVEAAAAGGAAIICSDVAPIGELLYDGESACVVPLDAEDIATNIKKILLDTNLRCSLVETAQEAAEREFSDEGEYLRMYKNSWEKVNKK